MLFLKGVTNIAHTNNGNLCRDIPGAQLSISTEASYKRCLTEKCHKFMFGKIKEYSDLKSNAAARFLVSHICFKHDLR